MARLTTYYSNRLSKAPQLVPKAPKMWYLADYGVAYNTDGGLTLWRDSSGNGFDLVPDGGSAARSPDTLNGQAMVRATGRLATRQNSGIVGDMPRTVYFLGRLVSGNVVVSSGGRGIGRLFECMQARNSPLIHAFGGGMDNWFSLVNQPVYESALWAWRYSGPGSGYCDFNAQRGPQGGPPFMNTVDTPLYLSWGAYYGSSVVDVVEILVYDRFLTKQEDLQVRRYLGNKGGVPFAAIPGQQLQAWWQADQDWVSNEQGVLTQWQDQSGNQRHLIPDPAFVPPKLEVWANSKPAPHFDIGNMVGILDLRLKNPTVYTLVLALQKQSGTDNGVVAAFGSDEVHANILWDKVNCFGLNNTNDNVYGVTNSDASLSQRLVVTAEIHSNNVPAFRMWFNDTAQTVADVRGAHTNRLLDAIFRLGNTVFRHHGDYFWQGWIAEVILYDRVLTDAERSQTLEYLRIKYALLPTAALEAPEVFSNYTFEGPAGSANGNWFAQERWAMGSGYAEVLGATGVNGLDYIYQDVTLRSGALYRVEFEVLSFDSGTLGIVTNGGNGGQAYTRYAPGVHSYTFTANTINERFHVGGSDNANVRLGFVSLKEVQ